MDSNARLSQAERALPPGRLKGPISWMARNPVAANLLMVVIMAGGVLGLYTVKQEVFPEFDLDMIVISVPYPGASPAEVEQGIILAIEEGVTGIDGVKRVTAIASEGVGSVTVELLVGADPDAVLSDVTSAVDRIRTFPEDAEEPVLSLASMRRHVISLVIAGDQDMRTLHDIAERARIGLLARPEITQVELGGVHLTGSQRPVCVQCRHRPQRRLHRRAVRGIVEGAGHPPVVAPLLQHHRAVRSGELGGDHLVGIQSGKQPIRPFGTLVRRQLVALEEIDERTHREGRQREDDQVPAAHGSSLRLSAGAAARRRCRWRPPSPESPAARQSG